MELGNEPVGEVRVDVHQLFPSSRPAQRRAAASGLIAHHESKAFILRPGPQCGLAIARMSHHTDALRIELWLSDEVARRDPQSVAPGPQTGPFPILRFRLPRSEKRGVDAFLPIRPIGIDVSVIQRGHGVAALDRQVERPGRGIGSPRGLRGVIVHHSDSLGRDPNLRQLHLWIPTGGVIAFEVQAHERRHGLVRLRDRHQQVHRRRPRRREMDHDLAEPAFAAKSLFVEPGFDAALVPGRKRRGLAVDIGLEQRLGLGAEGGPLGRGGDPGSIRLHQRIGDVVGIHGEGGSQGYESTNQGKSEHPVASASRGAPSQPGNRPVTPGTAS